MRAASRRAEPEKASSSFWYRLTCFAIAVCTCWLFLPPSDTAPISVFHSTCAVVCNGVSGLQAEQGVDVVEVASSLQV